MVVLVLVLALFGLWCLVALPLVLILAMATTRHEEIAPEASIRLECLVCGAHALHQVHEER